MKKNIVAIMSFACMITSVVFSGTRTETDSFVFSNNVKICNVLDMGGNSITNVPVIYFGDGTSQITAGVVSNDLVPNLRLGIVINVDTNTILVSGAGYAFVNGTYTYSGEHQIYDGPGTIQSEGVNGTNAITIRGGNNQMYYWATNYCGPWNDVLYHLPVPTVVFGSTYTTNTAQIVVDEANLALPTTGGTMKGILDMGGNSITNVGSNSIVFVDGTHLGSVNGQLEVGSGSNRHVIVTDNNISDYSPPSILQSIDPSTLTLTDGKLSVAAMIPENLIEIRAQIAVDHGIAQQGLLGGPAYYFSDQNGVLADFSTNYDWANIGYQNHISVSNDVSSTNIIHEGGSASVPIAQWKMNDNADSTVVVDSVGTNNGVAQQYTSVLHTNGIISGALSFNGSTDYINVSGNSSLAVSNKASFVFWMNTSDSSPQFVYGAYDTDHDQPGIGVFLNAVVPHKLSVWCGGPNWISSNTSIDDGIFHHIVITTDETNINIYIDGVLDQTGFIYGLNPYAGSKFIGAHRVIGNDNAGDLLFNGFLDDFRIYNTVFPSNDVANLYNAPSENVRSTPTPISQWKMNDSADSTVVLDSVGNNNGVAQNTTDNLYTSGKINGSLTFNGSSDYITLPTSIYGSNAFSVSMWVKRLGSFNSFRGLLSACPSGGGHNFIIVFPGDNRIQVGINGNTGTQINSEDTISDTNWHHVVFVYDEATVSSLYIDGKQQSTTPTDDIVWSDSYSPVLGLYYPDTPFSYNFDGLLDNICIYNIALSSNEVADIFNNPSENVTGGYGWSSDACVGSTLIVTNSYWLDSGIYHYVGTDSVYGANCYKWLPENPQHVSEVIGIYVNDPSTLIYGFNESPQTITNIVWGKSFGPFQPWLELGYPDCHLGWGITPTDWSGGGSYTNTLYTTNFIYTTNEMSLAINPYVADWIPMSTWVSILVSGTNATTDDVRGYVSPDNGSNWYEATLVPHLSLDLNSMLFQGVAFYTNNTTGSNIIIRSTTTSNKVVKILGIWGPSN